MLAADLAPLALDLALWGSDDLAFLTPPPAPAIAQARALLAALGALADGRITDHGRAMAGLAVQNFVSASVGIAVAIALVRGFARHDRCIAHWPLLTGRRSCRHEEPRAPCPVSS